MRIRLKIQSPCVLKNMIYLGQNALRMKAEPNRQWWKESVVYQVYPRSYQDSNGDGIGDLNGITSRLDYIKSLGVDVIWLNPVYKSPNDDNGYDISDYRTIMDEFGNMEDFDRLLAGMKERGLKLLMDLVPNHSSDEHQWFVESRKSRENPYRDYYHWWPAEKGEPPARFSFFDVENNAWKYDERTDSYYLHYFTVKQPDLKWENPKVREEIYDIMQFWIDKGVDGFRMDVIPFISKDTNFPELPDKYEGNFMAYYADGPKLHDYLHEMNQRVLSPNKIMSVGEAPGVSLDQALDFVDEDRQELNMFFHFDLMSLDRSREDFASYRKEGWKLTEFKKVFSDWDQVFSKKGWGSVFLDNHDFPRAVSRWGNDSPGHWHHAATMLQTFLLTMRGTPYFYQGGEIGMTNVNFDRIEDYRDVNTLNKYQFARDNGKDLSEFIENEKPVARDNVRTPMQWDNTANAGFTEADPWIPLNKNFINGINVSHQEKDPGSVLSFFKRMVAIRKNHLVLVYGQYQLLLEDHEKVYIYLRSLGKDRCLIILSFSEDKETVEVDPDLFQSARLLISNAPESAPELKSDHIFELRPYQSLVYELH